MVRKRWTIAAMAVIAIFPCYAGVRVVIPRDRMGNGYPEDAYGSGMDKIVVVQPKPVEACGQEHTTCVQPTPVSCAVPTSVHERQAKVFHKDGVKAKRRNAKLRSVLGVTHGAPDHAVLNRLRILEQRQARIERRQADQAKRLREVHGYHLSKAELAELTRQIEAKLVNVVPPPKTPPSEEASPTWWSRMWSMIDDILVWGMIILLGPMIILAILLMIPTTRREIVTRWRARRRRVP